MQKLPEGSWSTAAHFKFFVEQARLLSSKAEEQTQRLAGNLFRLKSWAEGSMEIWEQLSRQRVKHIISSYQLGGEEPHRFDLYLDELLQLYPRPLIELALIETLIDHWLSIPLLRGIEFLTQAHDKLKNWETQPIVSTITPEQFQQIAGLDPTPIFGSAELPPACPIVRPI